jgi:hypothetical protein
MTADVRIQTLESKSAASRKPGASRPVLADPDSWLWDQVAPGYGLRIARDVEWPLLVAWWAEVHGSQ